MSDNTFDGSSSSAGTTTYDDSPNGAQLPAAVPTGPAAAPYAPESLLDELRAEITERDEEPIPPWIYAVKGTRIRLVCDPDIDNEDYQRWFKMSMPRQKGRSRARVQTAADMDQLALSARAIAESNTAVELLRKDTTDEWAPIPSAKTNEPLTVMDDELLRAFNVMDPVSLLRKFFRKDAELIDAGQALLEAAGYLGDDDDEDPTPPARSERRAKKH